MAKTAKDSAVMEEVDLIEKINELETRIQFMTDLFDKLHADVKKMQEFKQPTGVGGLDLQIQFEKCLEVSLLTHIKTNPNLIRKAADNTNYVRRDAKGIIDFATVLHEEICNSFANKTTKK
jgi:hypothetical protein